jgi:hypothetical protein
VQPGVYGEQMRGMQLGGSTTQPAPLLAPSGAGATGVIPERGMNKSATPASPPDTGAQAVPPATGPSTP